MVGSIMVSDLKKMLGQINIIDIRSIERYNNNHIPTAKNIPQEKLLINPNKYLNKNDTYYIYCQKGKSSVNIAMILEKQGFKIVNIEGGYERWILMN